MAYPLPLKSFIILHLGRAKQTPLSLRGSQNQTNNSEANSADALNRRFGLFAPACMMADAPKETPTASQNDVVVPDPDAAEKVGVDENQEAQAGSSNAGMAEDVVGEYCGGNHDRDDETKGNDDTMRGCMMEESSKDNAQVGDKMQVGCALEETDEGGGVMEESSEVNAQAGDMLEGGCGQEETDEGGGVMEESSEVNTQGGDMLEGGCGHEQTDDGKREQGVGNDAPVTTENGDSVMGEDGLQGSGGGVALALSGVVENEQGAQDNGGNLKLQGESPTGDASVEQEKEQEKVSDEKQEEGVQGAGHVSKSGADDGKMEESPMGDGSVKQEREQETNGNVEQEEGVQGTGHVVKSGADDVKMEESPMGDASVKQEREQEKAGNAKQEEGVQGVAKSADDVKMERVTGDVKMEGGAAADPAAEASQASSLNTSVAMEAPQNIPPKHPSVKSSKGAASIDDAIEIGDSDDEPPPPKRPRTQLPLKPGGSRVAKPKPSAAKRPHAEVDSIEVLVFWTTVLCVILQRTAARKELVPSPPSLFPNCPTSTPCPVGRMSTPALGLTVHFLVDTVSVEVGLRPLATRCSPALSQILEDSEDEVMEIGGSPAPAQKKPKLAAARPTAATSTRARQRRPREVLELHTTCLASNHSPAPATALNPNCPTPSSQPFPKHSPQLSPEPLHIHPRNLPTQGIHTPIRMPRASRLGTARGAHTS